MQDRIQRQKFYIIDPALSASAQPACQLACLPSLPASLACLPWFLSQELLYNQHLFKNFLSTTSETLKICLPNEAKSVTKSGLKYVHNIRLRFHELSGEKRFCLE